MKFAVITDTHFGCRGDAPVFLDQQERFFSDVFFPKLAEEGVSVVLDLGDTFDRRKFINFVTLERARSFFFDQLAKRGMEYHAVVGNHSCYYKNTNEINSMELLLQGYSNFHLYSHEPVELEFGSAKVLMSPWITKENYQVSINAFENSKAKILAGHFEIKGFEMMKGRPCDHGFDKSRFSHFESVWSGHFHHPSKYGNIEYLGAPYEMTWSDAEGVRGFHIYDTETDTLTRIENPYKMFRKITYDDTDLTVDDIAALDVASLRDSHVKLVVTERTNPQVFDLFLDKLSNSGAADVKVVEDTMKVDDISEEEITAGMEEDTQHILHSYIDSIDTKVAKKKLKSVIDELYTEALNT